MFEIPARKKRSEEKTGHRTKAELAVVSHGEMQPVKWPRARKTWSYAVKEFYNSVKDSGQTYWYQQSDVSRLRLFCDELERYKSSGRQSAMMYAALTSEMSNLMVSESDRRKANIELQHPESNEEEDAQVAHIENYRHGLMGPASKAE
ncbi:hypothetical protein GCM10009700_35400 [Brevibacterium sanguinis]|uniref:phage terminase small subunit n=1 Tax=Brevibacterium sanguinis TaxID=232444 RepID=UPI0031DFEC37